jgi:hypothetical protein
VNTETLDDGPDGLAGLLDGIRCVEGEEVESLDIDPIGNDGMTHGERTFTERGPTPGRDWHGSVTILNAERVCEAMRSFLVGKKYTWVSYQNTGDADYFYTPNLRSGQYLDPADTKDGTAISVSVHPFPYYSQWPDEDGNEVVYSPNAAIHWHDSYGVGAIHTYAMDVRAANALNREESYSAPYVSFRHSGSDWHGILSITFRVGAGTLTEWHFVIEPEPFERLPWITPHPEQLAAVCNILVEHAGRHVSWEEHDFNYPRGQNGAKKQRAAEILAKARELAALIKDAENEWGPNQYSETY